MLRSLTRYLPRILVCACVAHLISFNFGVRAGGSQEPPVRFKIPLDAGLHPRLDGVEFEEIPAEARADVCRMLVAKIKQNHDRLHTWSGKFQCDDRVVSNFESLKPVLRRPVAGPVERVSAGDFTFDLNRDTGKLAVDFRSKNEKMIELATGEPVQMLTASDVMAQRELEAQKADKKKANKPRRPQRYLDDSPFVKHSIVGAKEFLWFQPNETYGDFIGAVSMGIHGRAAFRESAEKAEGEGWSVIPDPGTFFTGRSLYQNVEYKIKSLTAPVSEQYSAEEKAAYSAVVKISRGVLKSDGSVMYAIKFLPTNRPFESVHVYDEKADYNAIVYWYAAIGSWGLPGLRHAYEFREEGGVYLPHKVVNTKTNEKNQIEFQRTLTLLESRVNEPISDDKFTVARFGLKNGDRFVDRIDGKIQLVQDERLTYVGDVDSGERKETSESSIWESVIWINLALLILLLVARLLFWVRARTKRAPIDALNEVK